MRAYLRTADVPASWSLFEAYLTLGAADGDRVEVRDPDVRAGFADPM